MLVSKFFAKCFIVPTNSMLTPHFHFTISHQDTEISLEVEHSSCAYSQCAEKQVGVKESKLIARTIVYVTHAQ